LPDKSGVTKSKRHGKHSGFTQFTQEKRLGHVLPRYYRDKEWEIDNLDNVDMAEDGSLWCTIRWKPTRLKAKTLVREALGEILEELFTEKYRVEAWNKL
jgi:hypothetical protein